MNELDPRLERRVARLRELPEPDLAARARLRVTVERERTKGMAGPFRSAPRRLLLTPSVAAAALLATVVATSLLWHSAGPMGTEDSGSPTTPVQFVLQADGARTVALVGDFNDWNPASTPLAETGRGVWSVVVPLRPGMVRYSFLVDEQEWRADPGAARVSTDFGRPTSLALVGEWEPGR